MTRDHWKLIALIAGTTLLLPLALFLAPLLLEGERNAKARRRERKD